MKREFQKLLICAGEHSGDLIAAELVLAFKHTNPDLQIAGVVGDAMRKAGVKEFLGIESLSVMGFSEVLKRIGEFRILEARLLEQIDRFQPQVAVLVDFPGFHMRLAEQLKLRGIRVIQYVAPKLWAWGEKRIGALKNNFDMVLGILPFEESYFQSRGVNYKYVGSPHVDRVNRISIRKEDLGFSSSAKLCSLLPGSRSSELEYILPLLIDIKKRLNDKIADLKFVMPLAPNMPPEALRAVCEDIGIGSLLTLSPADKNACIGSLADIQIYQGMSLELMGISDAAVIASGTATLESALIGLPTIVVYRMSAGSFDFAQNVVKCKYVSLVNLILGKEAVPEFLQHVDAGEVANLMQDLLAGGAAFQKQEKCFSELRETLKGDASRRAAAEIVRYVAEV